MGLPKLPPKTASNAEINRAFVARAKEVGYLVALREFDSLATPKEFEATFHFIYKELSKSAELGKRHAQHVLAVLTRMDMAAKHGAIARVTSHDPTSEVYTFYGQFYEDLTPMIGWIASLLEVYIRMLFYVQPDAVPERIQQLAQGLTREFQGMKAGVKVPGAEAFKSLLELP